ncbi:ATP-binding protein [Pseudomonas asiatica]|uniref:AAA family ATPase n=1 Tax=Pseudomonas asiatica TaxID=2219225 RepID=UPI00244D7A2C|nr:AAA family ATPase [Pseudomonas asiatica]MDH0133549.1 ATP-binding protein [Pseudomonas asiatica]
MIIRSFYARKVHGVYDFDLQFKPDVNFLVGPNGTGKTTALRLIQAAISFDIETLHEITFSIISVDVDKDGEDFKVTIKSTDNGLSFALNGQDIGRTDPSLGTIEEGRFVTRSGRVMRVGSDMRNQLILEGGPLLNKFLQGRRPMFLGLERRLAKYHDEFSFDSEYSVNRIFKSRMTTEKKEPLDGLENCQKLVEGAFRHYRRASDGRLDRLLNIVVESTFEYIEFDENFLNDSQNTPFRLMSELQQRRQELEKFASDLGGSEKTSQQIEKFFEKMDGIAKPTEERSDVWSLEWLINMAQIRRIQHVLAEMDRQKKSAEKFFAPIKEFCETLNEFFRHSHKELSIDSVGKIKVSQQGKNVELMNLSSGEKQLLILLSHARFASTRKNAFIVDEPEISLHMRWQEMLVDSLLSESKGNQFIFATHSPEIVGYHVENCINLG